MIGFNPFPAQERVINSKADEIVVVAGRRFGKTTLMAYRILIELTEPNKIVWLVAPNYELTLKTINQVLIWARKLFGAPGVTYRRRPYPELTTFHGSVLKGKSADNPVSLLGSEVDFLGVDEAARLDRIVYEQYLFPVTQDRHAQTMFITTPTGKNWLYERWMKAGDGAFRFESRERPTFTEGMWKAAKAKLPERIFNQEYRAMFVEGAASVFREDDIHIAIDEKVKPESIEGHDYVMGVDLARFQDYTVVTVADRWSNQVKLIERWGETEYPFQKKKIKALAAQYNNAEVYMDSSGVGRPIYEDLFRDGVFIKDFSFAHQSKSALIEKLSIMLEQHQLTYPRNDVLIKELESFQVKMTESNRAVYSAPGGMHDDCVISLALAAWGLDAYPMDKNKIRQKEVLAQIKKDESRRKATASPFTISAI